MIQYWFPFGSSPRPIPFLPITTVLWEKGELIIDYSMRAIRTKGIGHEHCFAVACSPRAACAAQSAAVSFIHTIDLYRSL